jgi:hypothetical protein
MPSQNTPSAGAWAPRLASTHPTVFRLIGPPMQPATPKLVSALAELSTLDQWVVSKLVDGQKPPFSPLTRRKCSHSNPSQWSSYQVACKVLAGFDWLGFVFHESDPYSGIDLDGCRDRDTGAIEAWALELIEALNSYTEVSPSGTGVKVFVRGTVAAEIKHSLGPHKGIEVYSTKRFFTVTGQHLAGTPAEIREAQPALDSLWNKYHKAHEPAAPRKEYRVSISKTGNGRQSASEVIGQLNRSNDLGNLLESFGGQLIGRRNEPRHYSGLAGDQHSNGLTYTVSLAQKGGHIGYSQSPNGKLNNVDHPQGFDWFTAYVVLNYGSDTKDNRIAALKALNPIQPRQQAQAAPQRATEYVLAPELVEARRKDAQRKKEQRQQAADTLRDTLLGRAAIDEDMPWQARLVLDTHITLAGQRGWHRASIARMAKMLGRGDRWVQRFNECLIDRYVSRTLESRHDTAIWTLLEKPIERIDTLQTDNLGVIELEAESTDDHPIHLLENIESTDLLELVSGGASSLDDWQWSNDDHGADELAGLFDEPVAQVDTARAELLVYVYALACELGQVASYDGYTFAQLETEADRLAAVLDSPHSPAITPFNDAAEPEAASYDPSLSILQNDRPYSGTTARQYLPDAERRRLAAETMWLLPEVDAGDIPEQLPLEQPTKPRKPAKERKPSALDRYQVEVALMSDQQLAGELKKHTATLKKHSGARWLADVRDKLRLVEAELDSRDTTPAQAPRNAHQKPLQLPQAIQLAMAA